MYKVVVPLLLVSLGLAQDDQSKENATITKLNLSNKGLTSLNNYDFTKYPQLEELDLSNNLLETIKEDKFTKNKNLKKLNLSGNTLLKLPEFSTLLIAGIEELNLSNCSIHVFPPSILDGLIKLRVIDLSNNPLTSIKLITFTNLLSPEKIILPNLNDKAAIKEICNELNIVIEDNEEILRCTDVRNNKWEPTKKDDVSKLADQPIIDTSVNPPSTTEDSSPKPATSVKKDDEQKTLKLPDTVGGISDVSESSKANSNTDAETAKTPENVQPITTENQTKTLDTSKLNNTSSSSAVEDKEPDVVELPKPTQDRQTATDVISTEQQIGTNQIPEINSDTKDIEKPQINEEKSKPDIPNLTVRVAPPETIHTEINKKDKAPVNNGPLNENAKTQANNQVQQNKQEESSEASTGASTPASTGTNILIFLVVAVVISGMAAFGYRFYKTRTHRTSTAHEPAERELKEIVTDKRRPTLSNVLEEEPLMHKNEGNADVKEVGETKANGANHVPTVPATDK